MRRDLCARCGSVVMVGLLVSWFLLCVAGCAGRQLTKRWVDTDEVLLASSREDIKAQFDLVFAGYAEGSSRFSLKEVEAGEAKFLLVTTYPYRGRVITGIYCFEELGARDWRLRATIPVIDGSSSPPMFVAVGDSVRVMDGEHQILVVDSIKVGLAKGTPK